jgi:hypothetical protein
VDAGRASATLKVALKDLQIVQGVTLALARPRHVTMYQNCTYTKGSIT